MNAFSPLQNLRQVYLSAGETEARLTDIRQRTHTGRPQRTEEFIQDLEKVTQRRIARPRIFRARGWLAHANNQSSLLPAIIQLSIPVDRKPVPTADDAEFN
ncbi:MAG: hypothetical protein WCD57_16165, partial [Acidobacteriaceae bacterium]